MSAYFPRIVLVASVAGLALASCVATPQPSTPVELTFASWVFISPEQEAFMDEVESESDGSITFSAFENWTEPDGVEKLSDEFAMAEAIAAGDIDVGWTSTRSFPALGIDGFRAIEAPFLIQNDAGTREIVSGPIGEEALAALKGIGLTGLSIYPGSLRFPVTAGSPLRDPSDWAGKRILYYAPSEDSVQARTVEALGGEPVDDGLHILEDLKVGAYDGGTDSLADVAAGGATESGPYLTSNVIFWPTILIFVVNSDAFASLDEEQRAIIRAAAQGVADATLAEPAETTIGQRVCATTGRFGTASAEQLIALRAAVEPVYDWLESDPKEATLLERLREIASAHPEPDTVEVPEGCDWDPALAG